MVVPAGSGFRLDKVNGKVGGVCAGLANWMGVDPLWLRLAFAVTALVGFGTSIVIYALIWALAK